jgi:predicted lipid-binding transport protein (Tim44 family)
MLKGNRLLQARWYAPPGMTPDAAPSPHSLATASGLLLGTLAAAMALGALVGWAFGSGGLGLLIGAMVGIPLGALVVYQVYGRRPTA